MQIAESRKSSHVYKRDLFTRKLRVYWFIASQHHKSCVCNVTCHTVTNKQKMLNIIYSVCICALIIRRAMYMDRALARIDFVSFLVNAEIFDTTYAVLHVKCLIVFVLFYQTSKRWPDFSRKFSLSNLAKITQVRCKFLHVHGQTDLIQCKAQSLFFHVRV
jgi:hypothetical protein